MKVRGADDVPAEEVEAGTGTTRQVLIGPDEAPNFALRRFTMRPGGGMPLHTNEVEHEQYVLGGRATVTIGDEQVTAEAGDVLYVPAGVPHSYRAEGEVPFQFLCAVPNEPDRIELAEDGS